MWRYCRTLLFGLAGPILPGLLLGGCNNQPNQSARVGPTILLTLAAAPGYTWPPNTPNLTSNHQLQILATSASPGGTIQFLPTESNPPNYDWFAAVSPGDNSGIRYLSVTVTFFSDCGGKVSSAYPQSLLVKSQAFGSSPTGPLQSPAPLFVQELSPKVIGTYSCSGQLGYFPGGEVGLYYILANSTNGNGKSNTAAFLVKIGNVDGINFGP
jgi:hypothetical protein